MSTRRFRMPHGEGTGNVGCRRVSPSCGPFLSPTTPQSTTIKITQPPTLNRIDCTFGTLDDSRDNHRCGPQAASCEDIGRYRTGQDIYWRDCYVVSYILCASAREFGQYIGGYIINNVDQTGMQILNQIIVADITSSRWRGLANGLVSLPFMIIPWCSAFIVDSVLANIGWRWGIGMFAIIMPACSLSVIGPLVWFQRRLERAGGCVRTKPSIRGFGSQIDFSGMLLLPIALAGNAKSRWSTPWVPTLIAKEVACLALLIYYESQTATKPAMPPRLFKSSGTGLLMYRSKRYKWLLLVGIVIRLIGGAVGTVVIVVAQIVVSRAGLAHSTALELLCIYLGNSAGSAVAGTIYTSLFKEQLRLWMGLGAPQAAINSVYDSITAVVPRPGTSNSNAINHAYSDILRFMTIAALVASAIPMVMIWFLPNPELNDKHNLAGTLAETGEPDTQPDLADETRPRKWKRRMRW
ncbi:uncharacterized protein A1O5_02229 [Cladophialophora psammophila CBS 110553]|uniref:Major facilitator superfamily (MFS) profile domain-containing protein n=1 Tax=Cladophialophora psammophila CBS 110553 TaxID=1182543 RepID=W9X9E1_9EURO|nr:uncharacterized protein A1O5_02229 [Cladophialophora psammophila CBS 110553]EXJ73935.1 hypothetical protein A1O5_02229 [Cladophialophora psammophila CBS 110553]